MESEGFANMSLRNYSIQFQIGTGNSSTIYEIRNVKPLPPQSKPKFTWCIPFRQTRPWEPGNDSMKEKPLHPKTVISKTRLAQILAKHFFLFRCNFLYQGTDIFSATGKGVLVLN